MSKNYQAMEDAPLSALGIKIIPSGAVQEGEVYLVNDDQIPRLIEPTDPVKATSIDDLSAHQADALRYLMQNTRVSVSANTKEEPAVWGDKKEEHLEV
jgi:hypothetical protein